jgi:hypothetical protein
MFDLVVKTDSYCIAAHSWLVPELPLVMGVGLWEKIGFAAAERRSSSLRHEFAIGPLCKSDLYPGEQARLYYCIRCNWRFLVGGSKVAVLDETGKPIVVEKSLHRFSTFGEGPCPVLEVFASADLQSRPEIDAAKRNHRYSPGLTGQPRPLLRIFNRTRKTAWVGHVLK